MTRHYKHDIGMRHPLRKFIYWKYSGLIVVPTICIIIVLSWTMFTQSQEFYDTWSCATIKKYLMDLDTPDEMINHNDLMKEPHLKLHVIWKECLDINKFTPADDHDMLKT